MKNFALAAFCFAALTGCATTAPQTQAGLGSQMPLHPVAPSSPAASEIGSNALVYRTPDLNISEYHGIFVPTVSIYAGSDADFGSMDAPTKGQIAAYLAMAFIQALKEHHINVVLTAGPGIVTLQLILGGVSATHPVASLTRLTPIGAGITVLKSAAGMPAAFVGSITVAGEMTDDQGKILGGFVTKGSPLAYDLRSSLGTTTTAELAADRVAGDFAAAIVALKNAPAS
jgi:Protein of unknown function (DUF3313)